MGKRIADLADGIAWNANDSVEISRGGAQSMRLSLPLVRAGLFPDTGGTVTGNMGVEGDFTVNGASQFNGGAFIFGLLDVQGQITFLDNTSPGLILNNLTTTQRDALAVGGGELIYNSSTNTADFFNGSTWESIALSGDFVQKAGDTMTGLLGFTGSSHAGLRLNILTTAEKNALTPGAADFLYDSTLSRPFYWDGFNWQTFVKTSGDTMTGALIATEIGHATGNIVIKPAEVDGSLPFGFNTTITHTSNYLFVLANNNVPKLLVGYDGGIVAEGGITLNGGASFSSNTALLNGEVADGSTPYTFDTSLAHTSGNLVDVKNFGVSKFSVDYAGGVTGVAAVFSTVSAGSYSSTGDEMTLDASAADGNVAFKFDTNVAHTSGNLLSIGNNGSTKASVNYLGTGDFANLTVAQSTLAYGATTTVDLLGDGFKTVTLAGDVTFATSNRAAKRSVTLRIICDGTPRNFTFPSWVWVGDVPTGIAASKNAILTLTATGAAETDVIAAYAVQA